ncbi:helix-turn-helix domain-containing protein [Streptomyces jumonjinensis]|uniref:helix-turn-helix domain-containing protein n=1 Tax=Streptomyces jumonjinensis TaxID=1945 RepID=UPI0037B2D7E9
MSARVSGRWRRASIQRRVGSRPALSVSSKLAQRLLERGDEPVERIAAQTGLGTPANLRHHFLRFTGTSPSVYRTAFRSLVSTVTWADRGAPEPAPARHEPARRGADAPNGGRN